MSTAAPTATAGAVPATGPMRSIIAGSLVVGATAAALLTLGVVGGAPEPVITVAPLLGLALGWAMLAVLSARLHVGPLLAGPAQQRVQVGGGLHTVVAMGGVLAQALPGAVVGAHRRAPGAAGARPSR